MNQPAKASAQSGIGQPWRAAFPDAANWDAPIAIGTVPALLDRAAYDHGDRPAIEFRDRRLSYRALAGEADRLSAGLLAMGIGKGDAVALHLPNTPWHPIAFFGVARTGARIVHLSPLDAPRELAHKLRDSGARTLVTTNLPGHLPTAFGVMAPGVVTRVLVSEAAAWDDTEALSVPWSDRVMRLPEAPPPPRWPVLSPDDPCLLQYTGGTTGEPKGAMLTHGNLTAAVSIYRLCRDHAPAGSRTEHRIIVMLPLFHIYGLTTLLLRHIAEGNELLLRQRFDVETLLDDIGRKRATSFCGVPTMWTALVNHPQVSDCDFSSLRNGLSGGAPLPFAVGQKVAQLTGVRLRIGWGMTETAPAGTRLPANVDLAPGLIGIPLPGIDLRIVDRDDGARVLPPGEAGEIAISGPNVFRGYWNRPAETEAAFRDGFFLTGDIGRMDERGLFTLIDRKKRMIISSGFNVYPAVIESAIYEHPDIAEAIVIGVPDAYRGESAKAFVILKPGAPAMTLAALQAFLAGRLGRHEMPVALELRDQLPRSPVGKLLARVLQDEERAKAHAKTA
jgi:long-chain acyl-CoA synthetase